ATSWCYVPSPPQCSSSCPRRRVGRFADRDAAGSTVGSAAVSGFTLRQLRYFCAIAGAGSISAAAEAERVSRSTLAAALDELERELGATLCTRNRAHG